MTGCYGPVFFSIKFFIFNCLKIPTESKVSDQLYQFIESGGRLLAHPTRISATASAHQYTHNQCTLLQTQEGLSRRPSQRMEEHWMKIMTIDTCSITFYAGIIVS